MGMLCQPGIFAQDNSYRNVEHRVQERELAPIWLAARPLAVVDNSAVSLRAEFPRINKVHSQSMHHFSSGLDGYRGISDKKPELKKPYRIRPCPFS